jgi:hypothetical protein
VTGCDNAAPPLICEVFVTFHKKQFSAGKCFRYIPGIQPNPQTGMKHCVNVRFSVIFRVKVNVKISVKIRPETSIPNPYKERQPKTAKTGKCPKQAMGQVNKNHQKIRHKSRIQKI